MTKSVYDPLRADVLSGKPRPGEKLGALVLRKRFNTGSSPIREAHNALIAGCGSHWIVQISEQLFDAAERYRVLGIDFVSPRNELEEHRALVDACSKRNADQAVSLLRFHYGRTYEVMVYSGLAGSADV